MAETKSPAIHDADKRRSLRLGAGDARYSILLVQHNNHLASEHTDNISYLPYADNVDSYGDNTRSVAPGIPYEYSLQKWYEFVRA